MTIDKMMQTIHDTYAKYGHPISISIHDDVDNLDGIITALPIGNNFKIYMPTGIEGENDYIVALNTNVYNQLKDERPDEKIITVEEFESGRYKLQSVKSMLNMHTYAEIDEYLTL